MKSFLKVLQESLIVGILLVIIVYIVGFLLSIFKYPMGIDKEVEKQCTQWNKYYFMEISLLLSGMLFHIGCEYLGINKWYVDNYYK